jgi:tRNA-splicing ligase RtcB (3'-phosphate/5'-hydroxy nucleic acid ligase)
MATKWDKKIRKIEEDVYQIDKEGCMNVPVKIFASEKLLEKIKTDDSIQQGVNMACLPGIQKQSIMLSDAHQGYGAPIGGVAAFDAKCGCISPGLTGFDINCGVRLLTTNLTKKDVEGNKIKELIDTLFDNVPSGVGSESSIRLSDEDYEEVLNHGLDWTLKENYATREDLEMCEENGHMKTADDSKISPRARKRGRRQLGTLGAGNHFLEIQFVNEIFDENVAKVFGLKKDQIVVLVHTGSRGLGHQTCSDYLKKIEDEFSDIVDKLPEKDLAYAPTDSQLGKDYLGAMSAAANYAWCNRQLITYFTRNAFRKVFGDSIKLDLVYDVAHNIVKVEEYEIDGKKTKLYTHRKGATRSLGPGHKEIPEIYRKTGQPIFIPGSMGTSSWVLVGTDKARDETFSSAPHGAGRMMSRHEANRRFNTEEIMRDLEKNKIYIRAASRRGITEESPGSYKDVDEVVEVAHKVGIGRKVARLIPLGCVKG